MKTKASGEVLQALKKRSVAVASGKGGVGKSTTALNLAVYYAKMGMKVGLFDIDPLSNIATILDIGDPAETSAASAVGGNGRKSSLPDFILPVFKNLDLVFPRPKLKKGESGKLLSRILDAHADELLDRYRILIFDLPAGIGKEENLDFLPYADHLLVVTNSEPTSHVSAGGYIKAALETVPDIRVYFWHNKYSLIQDSGFNPRQVIENYNRHVADELKIDRRKLSSVKDIAYIPHDPSLDLLQNTLSLEGSVQLKILETCEVLQKKLLSDIPDKIDLDDNGRNLIKHYIAGLDKLSDVKSLAAEVEEYYGNFYRNTSTQGIGKFLARRKLGSFSDKTRSQLKAYLTQVKAHKLRNLSLDAVKAVEASLEELKDSARLFAVTKSPHAAKRIEQKLLLVLTEASRTAGRLDGFARNLSGILLFYFALFKLMPAKPVRDLVFSFVPKRKTSRGTLVRNKNKQIHYLVEKDADYHDKYFKLVRTLFPVTLKQLSAIVGSFKLGALVLKTADGESNKNAYLKLLTSFVHDAVHSGLGVFIGFKFNTASESIKKGAKELLQEIGLSGG